MRNEVAKQILSCKSGKDGVRRIIDGLSATLTSGRTAANIGQKWEKENPLFNAMTEVKVGKILYTSQDIDNQYATAKQWSKADSNMYYEVVVATVKWSEPVEELPTGAESAGEMSDAVLIVDNLGKWYTGEDDDHNTIYCQVIADTVAFSQGTSVVPQSVSGDKTQDVLKLANVGNWYIDKSAVYKSLQALTVTPTILNTQIVYKMLDVAQEDVDDLNESGEYAEFEEFATWELRRHVEDYVIGNVIGGKFTSEYTGTSLYRFITSEVSSVFTTVTTETQASASDYSYVTLDKVTAMCNDVDSDHKWLVIHPDDLAALISEVSNVNPVADKYAIAGHVDVEYVYSTRLAKRGRVICLDPSEFWKRDKNEISVAYPVYDYNKMNMLYEMNIGIKPHRPLCSAMLVGSLVD